MYLLRLLWLLRPCPLPGGVSRLGTCLLRGTAFCLGAAFLGALAGFPVLRRTGRPVAQRILDGVLLRAGNRTARFGVRRFRPAGLLLCSGPLGRRTAVFAAAAGFRFPLFQPHPAAQSPFRGHFLPGRRRGAVFGAQSGVGGRTGFLTAAGVIPVHVLSPPFLCLSNGRRRLPAELAQRRGDLVQAVRLAQRFGLPAHLLQLAGLGNQLPDGVNERFAGEILLLNHHGGGRLSPAPAR